MNNVYMSNPALNHRNYLGSIYNMTWDAIPWMRVAWMYIEKFTSPISQKLSETKITLTADSHLENKLIREKPI